MHNKPNLKHIGNTTLGLPLNSINFLSSGKKILIIGGVHGDEIESVELCNELISSVIGFDKKITNTLYFIPCLNLDGFYLKTRSNVNNVDLNRNLNTSNWQSIATDPRYQPGPESLSEVENKALVSLIEDFKPDLIISLHSFKQKLFLWNNVEDTSCTLKLNKAAEILELEIVSKMNYSVFGSLSVWGKERNISVLTVEAPRGNTWSDWKSKYVNQLLGILLDY